MIRRLLPASLKLRIRLAGRAFSDWKKRKHSPLAVSGVSQDGDVYWITKQPIKRTSLFENKVHNLRRAAAEIAQVTVNPGEVFSFWKIIGNPTEKRGYKTGRNIVNGTLQEAVGGGLCQLSGMVYYTALQCGLKIEERHNHTIDIYREEDRFTPLGSDATVVYGYKDLRFRNNLHTPVRLVFSFEEEAVSCGIHCSEKLTPRELDFRRSDLTDQRLVSTFDASTGDLLAVSKYKLP